MFRCKILLNCLLLSFLETLFLTKAEWNKKKRFSYKVNRQKEANGSSFHLPLFAQKKSTLHFRGFGSPGQ